MNSHRIAHKLFFFFMFLVCALAVVSLVRSKAQASLLSYSESTAISYPTTTGVYSTTDKLNTDSSTSLLKETVASTTTTETTNTSTPVNTTTNTTNTTTNTVTQSPTISPEESANITKDLILSQSAGTSSTDTKTQTTTNTGATIQKLETKEVEIKDPVTNSISSQPSQIAPAATVQKATNEIQTYSQGQTFLVPTELKATELTSEKNPKLSGKTTQDLAIKNVQLVTKYGGEKSLLFDGRATPNAIFNIFIFSRDPIVMTVKADENGNWSYELTKDLAEGQHEVYVAVTEKSGRITAKAEPLAFVKTAQAATIIPVSELDENKSPMQKSTASYIMMALIIMSVCLAIALALIGILNHKYKTDETII